MARVKQGVNTKPQSNTNTVDFFSSSLGSPSIISPKMKGMEQRFELDKALTSMSSNLSPKENLTSVKNES